jgi:hypothetical protein
MGGIIQVDSVLNNNTSNLITQTNSTTITIGSTGQTISLASGASSSGFGLTWNPTVQSTNFTASVNVGYMVNTSTAAVTVTLPAAPSISDQIAFVDFQETAATNAIVLNPNGLKIDGTTDNTFIRNSGEGVTILYTGTTRGWIPVSAANEGTQALASPYNIDFLVIAGGGAGGGSYQGGGGGAGGYRTSTQAALPGTIITVTVGDGGAGVGGADGNSGSNSSISGTGLTTITSAGGGGGRTITNSNSNGISGGSGGGVSYGTNPGIPILGGSGNTPSTSPSQGNNGGAITDSYGTAPYRGSGGGGAGAVGSNGGTSGTAAGGAGTASSITGSSVTRAGGGGGSIWNALGGTGGTGGGGNGAQDNSPFTAGTAGTANTGGGGGAAWGNAGAGNPGYAGGKGVVILSMATVHYTGTTSGSPTVTTSGSNTILQFNGTGSYSA